MIVFWSAVHPVQCIDCIPGRKDGILQRTFIVINGSSKGWWWRRQARRSDLQRVEMRFASGDCSPSLIPLNPWIPWTLTPTTASLFECNGIGIGRASHMIISTTVYRTPYKVWNVGSSTKYCPLQRNRGLLFFSLVCLVPASLEQAKGRDKTIDNSDWTAVKGPLQGTRRLTWRLAQPLPRRPRERR